MELVGKKSSHTGNELNSKTTQFNEMNKLAVKAFSKRILCSGDLESKLARPVNEEKSDRGTSFDLEGGTLPARNSEIRFSSVGSKIPKPHQLDDPDMRASCLARFAHHELMAVELLAWALIRWPEAPLGLRQDWYEILADEQKHCRLYLERLDAHGLSLGDFELNPYFWRQAPRISKSPSGACAFLSGLGLTLEQANLDFTIIYGEAFENSGDLESSEVFKIVHRDEIRHVASASRWLKALSGEKKEVDRYKNSVPFPLSAARAKAKRFESAPRRAAGLEESFISFVKNSRSTQESPRR